MVAPGPFLLALSLVLSAMARAQSPGLPLDLSDPRFVREAYVHDPALPDGLAFLSTIRFASYLGQQDAIAWIQTETSLSEQDAASLLHLMLGALEAINSDYDRFKRLLVCAPDRPRAVGNAIYPLFEALDDARADFASQHLAIVKSKLPANRATVLDEWLDQRKLSITYVKFRHKEVYEQQHHSPDEALANMCANTPSTGKGSQ